MNFARKMPMQRAGKKKPILSVTRAHIKETRVFCEFSYCHDFFLEKEFSEIKTNMRVKSS